MRNTVKNLLAAGFHEFICVTVCDGLISGITCDELGKFTPTCTLLEWSGRPLNEFPRGDLTLIATFVLCGEIWIEYAR